MPLTVGLLINFDKTLAHAGGAGLCSPTDSDNFLEDASYTTKRRSRQVTLALDCQRRWITILQQDTKSISKAYRQHIGSISIAYWFFHSLERIFAEKAMANNGGHLAFLIHKLIQNIHFFGRPLPPGETQNIVENTVCYRYAVDMLSMCCRYSVGVFSPCGANSQNKCRPELVRRSREANSSKIIASETQPVMGTSVFKS